MPDDICIPQPPDRACGSVKTKKTYLRGQGGGGWGGGEGGTNYLFIPIVPPLGDESGVVTETSRRTIVRLIDLDVALSGAPEADWLIGNSLTNYLDKQWELHEVTVFGMLARQRLGNGIMEDVDSVAEAQQRLLAMKPDPRTWRSVGSGLAALARYTVENDALHTLVLGARNAHAKDKPFLVLARMHELLLRKRVPSDVRARAVSIVGQLAAEDEFWVALRDTEVANA